ncbi:hypothetical protein [Symbiopectobacterium sp. RP]|uniref:hypothetical protein n=1 Tax=Symbiopectobacterium sp. RP TaxID=3248553 RepID=UPI003D2C6E41
MITANALICGKKIQLIVIKIMSLGYSVNSFSVGLAFLISVSVSFVATFCIFAPSFLLPHR